VKSPSSPGAQPLLRFALARAARRRNEGSMELSVQGGHGAPALALVEPQGWYGTHGYPNATGMIWKS